jgi:multidrug resistance protein, MATE family
LISLPSMDWYQEYKGDFRNNVVLALPIMAGQLGQITVNIVDNLMVGHLGAEALAAISFSIAIFIVFFIVGMGISFALPPLVSKAQGGGKSRRISVYFKHSLVINVLYAIFSIALVELLIPWMPYMGQNPDVVLLAQPYLRIAIWSMIPMMLFQTLRCYADGMSETLAPMIAMLIGNVFNVIFNYILIYGKMGFPAMGVTGASLGTFISRFIMLFVMIVLLIYWKDLWSNIKNADYKKYQNLVFKKVLSLGIPSSLQMFFEVSAFGGAAMIMGALGKEEQAAHQIAINLASVTFMICTGMGMAATIRVGQQLGRKSTEGIRRVGVSAMIQILIFMTIGALVFIVMRDILPTFYISDIKVLEIAATLLIMAGIFQLSDGIQVVGLGALRGLQDVKVPTIITFIAYWLIGFPISYFTAFYSDLGPVGVWAGLVIGLTVSACLLTWRFFSLSKKAIIKKMNN